MKLKPLAAAVGMSLALTSFSASAVINWGSDLTLFEDNNIDFLIEENDNGIIEVGESLFAVFEIEEANGTDIAPQELTGVSYITLLTIADLDADGQVDDFVFGPNATFEAEYGDGAMVAMFLDDTPNLAISAGNVVGGTVSCTTLAQCIEQATDGTLWQVDGFSGDLDEYWIALNAAANTSVVLAGSAANEFGSINAGLGILFNGTGQNLAFNSLDCGVFCGTGGDGFVDMLVGGSIKGGAGLSAGLIADGAVATSDFDFTKRVAAVPEPASLALLGIGLMGLGAMRRTRKS